MLTILAVFWIGFWIFFAVSNSIGYGTGLLVFNIGFFFLLCLLYPSPLIPTQHNPNPANVGPGPSGDN
jgi:hypothetical protein